MNILIAGGSGFIGSHLTRHFLNKNDHVTVLDNYITGSKHNLEDVTKNPLLTIINADLVTHKFANIMYDRVYQLASPASPIQYKRYPVETLMVNSVGTKNLLDMMVKTGSRRFALASTSEVYGDPLEHPQKESYFGNVNPNGERSCYDEGKRFAESITMTYARIHGLDVRIARIFNTYGPYMDVLDGRVVSNFIVQALRNEPITMFGDGRQTRSFCHVSDMVRAFDLLGSVEGIDGEVINLGNPNERDMNELANTIISLTKSTSSITHLPQTADDPKKRKPDISKAKKLLNWEPTVELNDGLVDTIGYFARHIS